MRLACLLTDPTPLIIRKTGRAVTTRTESGDKREQSGGKISSTRRRQHSASPALGDHPGNLGR